MKKLITTIAAVVLVGCGESQQSAPPSETKPAEPVAEAATSDPPTAKALAISIHKAAERGNIEAVKQHLAAGVDVNAKSDDGGTPLLYAAAYGHRKIVELLIAAGADVNVKNENGKTTLHFAVLNGRKVIVELLIAKGADVNAKDEDGETPLDATYVFNKTETADLLRKHGGKTGEELGYR